MKSKGHLKDIARMLVALLIFLMSGQAWAQGAYGYTVPPDWERAFDAHRNLTAPDKFAEQQSSDRREGGNADFVNGGGMGDTEGRTREQSVWDEEW